MFGDSGACGPVPVDVVDCIVGQNGEPWPGVVQTGTGGVEW